MGSHLCLDVGRFIPACAGNTRWCVRSSPRRAVHPRVCGEHAVLCATASGDSGSSPRVRGTRDVRPGVVDRDRFIPACAGNTPRPSGSRRTTSVHPRVCGEHDGYVGRPMMVAGSSPRVRGTLHRVEHLADCQRFIPACAGNTHISRRCGSATSVHPRVCGEHGAIGVCAPASVGSSPRVRGTPGVHRRPVGAVRFIPACAGNTINSFAIRARSAVHPRVCGEHGFSFHQPRRLGGSSPRVRGTRSRRLARPTPSRFIPACAGNTAIRSAWCSTAAVHPRVCGEHRQG